MDRVPFVDMVDELLYMSHDDPELSAGVRYLNMRAREEGVTIYEMFDIALNGRRNYCSIWADSHV